jgi:hypothetical protein
MRACAEEDMGNVRGLAADKGLLLRDTEPDGAAKGAAFLGVLRK